jgi:hypothetical protein
MYVKQHVNLPDLTFVQDTAWNLPKYGTFDVIFCYGLLYHLERPLAFLRLISGSCRRALFLQSHFADHPNQKFNLSEICENEGLPGRWYSEYGGADSTSKMAKWSSWENSKSFWLTKVSLMKAINEIGFSLFFEQYDSVTEETRHRYYANENHGSFVAIK